MVTFNGHDLSTIGTIGTPSIKILDSKVTSREVSGRDGVVVESRTWGASTVSFPISIVGTAFNRRNSLSTLGSYLDVDEPCHLVLPDTPDYYYMAIPSGRNEISRGVDNETLVLEFTITEPAAYGTEKTVTVPSGGSVTFTVNGTYKTAITATASAVRNSTSLTWGLKLDNSKFVHIATGSASATSIVLDCGNRTLKVANSPALPTLDSDWLILEPGSHTLAMDYGTGAATVKYFERWL